MIGTKHFQKKSFTMSVKIDYTVGHLVWAAYSILDCADNYSPDDLNKRFVRDFLRKNMSLFGSDTDSLIGENYFNFADVDQIKYIIAEAWVLTQDWNKK